MREDLINDNNIAPQIEVEKLKKELEDTDYKITKCAEYFFCGLELPYDIQALHKEKQALRDRINELEN